MAVAIVLNYWVIYLMQRQITVKRSLLTRNTEVRKKDWRELSAQERNKVNKPTL
jgi:hypothetical protein